MDQKDGQAMRLNEMMKWLLNQADDSTSKIGIATGW